MHLYEPKLATTPPLGSKTSHNEPMQTSLVGVVGYHDRLTRGRSPVRTWYETLVFKEV